ncbi:AAWKG family protein [Streptomyces halstedii]|uniref:AAWKG family protein n=1 Tax=Streptomyces halstedii TaxID=1944 RepID=UPI0038241AAE
MPEERYDPTSKEHVDKYEGGTAKGDEDDVWANVVSHVTGYPVPKRSTVFEKLRSDHGGMLFRMDIKNRSLQDVLEKSGFEMQSGQDYDIWFFDQNGSSAQLKQARIVFEGTVHGDDGVQFADTSGESAGEIAVSAGNDFTDYNDQKLSTIGLAQYMNGPRNALIALYNGNTEGMSFNGLSVPTASAVDLSSFDRTAESFDRAAKFFKDHAVVIKGWEDALGKEDASWKGEAADVFRSLIKKVRENYEGYVDTFTGSGGQEGATGTVYARALAEGKQELRDAAQELLEAWFTWAKSAYFDPHRVLRYVLDELGRWSEANNITKTKIYTTTYPGYMGAPGATVHSARPEAGFSQTHPTYGDLSDMESWKKVGEEAVRIWSQGADTHLGEPAARVQSALNNSFLDIGDEFTENVPKPKTTSTASEDYADAQAEKEKAEAEKEKAEYEKEKAEAKAQAEKDKEEYEKEKAEAKAEKEKEKEEYEKEKAEAKAEKEKEKEEYEKEKAEAKAEAEREKAEYEKEKAEAEAKAEEERKQLEENLGNLNSGGGDGPGNIPVTTSLGDIGGLNGLGGDGTNGGLDGTGGDGTTGGADGLGPSGMPVTSVGGIGGINGAGGTGRDRDGAPVTQELGGLDDLNGPGTGGTSGLETPTGGSTSLDGGGLLTNTFPDGTSTSFDPGTGLLTSTAPDGTVTTTRLGDGATVTNPDGSTTTLDDGRLTTTFPDGTTQSIDPGTGMATTTAPDGTTTTTDLGTLGGLNSTGGTGTGGTDTGGTGTGGTGTGGSNTPDFSDIASRTVTESLGGLNGTGGTGGLESSTGGITSLNSGDFLTSYPDGSRASFDPDTGILTTTSPDGTTTTTDLTYGADVTNPDGSHTVLENGKPTTTFPDGSKQVIDPDTGIATVTDPQGNTRQVDLGSLNSPRDTGSLDTIGSRLGDLPSLDGLSSPGSAGPGGAGGGTGTGGSGGTGESVSLGTLDGLNQGSSSPLGDQGVGVPGSVTPLGGGGTDLLASNGQTPSGGLPDNAQSGAGGGQSGTGGQSSPGMPMSPMGGMGGAGGGDKGSHGERVRAVLTDAAEEGKRRNRRRRSPWGRAEDEDTFLTPASRPATTGGRTPEDGADASDRSRTPVTSSDYLEEDEDVWGTEGGSAPSVIGR